MTYEETLNYLYDRLPMFQRMGDQAYKKDLSNIRAFSEAMGMPQQHFKVVHVAGTNGKGSVSHMLSSVLVKAGYTAGLYTSPHLKSFKERIRINGLPIPERSVVSFVERYRSLIEEISPSFFEVTVAMAFEEFVRQNVEIAVIETGMGGRLDSTNIVNPLLSVITNIGWDHQQYLGNTLPEIAEEKAGIIKDNTSVLISEYQPEVHPVFRKKASEQNAPLIEAYDRYEITEVDSGTDKLTVKLKEKTNGEEREYTTDMAGKYQANNLRAAVAALDVLGEHGYIVSSAAISEGLSTAKEATGVKGRWHILQYHPMVICDAGHNPEGIQSIVNQLQELSYDYLWVVFGVVKDKDPGPVLELLPQDAYYFFCEPAMPRAFPAEELARKASEYNLNGMVAPDVNKALKKALEYAGVNDLIFAGGSTFVIAELEDI